MILQRPSAARGEVHLDWLHSRHTFSFGHYYDPAWMGFGVLRVINEDTVAPGGGFAPHRHANMEILSVVLSGALTHRDSTGNEGVIRAGEVQWMSAGHGIEHSEYNASADAPVHFLQIWLQPDRLNYAPAYASRPFPPEQRRGRWVCLAAPDGAEGGLPIRQQAWLRAARLQAQARLSAELEPAHRYWLHVASGTVAVGQQRLTAGDALGWVGEHGSLQLQGLADDSEVLLFTLPA
ncbi:MAG: pirin family protein [Thermomonas hydrothermalis]|uniref:pirin family protein n=1 Tax=Thermomonas hydrothermalis TaxID=213588 RepID=UPI00235755EC|nr:pirin family protein [Thermomonas hydrothermalis]MCL6619217.1 pirin family protein [Thermomonas hydrothermalis]